MKARKTRRRKVLRAGLNVLMAVGDAVLAEEERWDDMVAGAAAE